VLGDITAPKERGKYYGYFSITYTTAGASGPALGGFLADHLHWSAIFWLNIPLGLLALLVTSSLLRRLPRHERPHRLDILGAVLIVTASVSFMLALNLAGVRLPWTSAPILALAGVAVGVGALFVLRLLTAPEPLIPVSILLDPVARCAVAANAFGWGSIVGLNIFLPTFLQTGIGMSPTNAGLSLIVFMASLNVSAGLAGRVLCRVDRYKILPMAGLTLTIGAVLVLAWFAESLDVWSFELLLTAIGLGFGPLPSLTQVALQNSVPRHRLGISIGTMNFCRHLLSTILVALFGAIVLAGAAGMDTGSATSLKDAVAQSAPQGVAAFSRVFLAAATSLAIAFIAVVLLEEKPLQGATPEAAE
jgi:MFS family permease